MKEKKKNNIYPQEVVNGFWGDYFVYDGIPCTEFGLRLYEVNGVTPGEAKFSVASDISEDRVSSRYRPLFYGVTQRTSFI